MELVIALGAIALILQRIMHNRKIHRMLGQARQ